MKGRVLLNIVFFVSVANFLAFCAISEVIGGDAINGYAEHGRYFLRPHGRTTEVSEAVFAYSKWHAIPLYFLQRSYHAVEGCAALPFWGWPDAAAWPLLRPPVAPRGATSGPRPCRWRAYPHEPAPRGSEAKPGSAVSCIARLTSRALLRLARFPQLSDSLLQHPDIARRFAPASVARCLEVMQR